MNKGTVQTHGILNLDKPSEVTSMDMVRLAKRLTGERHVGHGGTLDPRATGVLPICFGQATRVMEYLVEGEKVYLARARLGITTDTYDAHGEITSSKDPSGATLEQVKEALSSFKGVIQQTPPMFSALKSGGKRLYDLARAGVEVERAPREVEVFHLEVTEWEPPFVGMEVRCGRGVYIRSLVHDLGEALGCGAYLDALRRVLAGPFNLSNAVTVERFTEACQQGAWKDLLLPLDVVFLNLKHITLDARQEGMLRNGRFIPAAPSVFYTAHMARVRAYGANGTFLGILRFDKSKGAWRPHKVFTLQAPSPYVHAGASLGRGEG